MESKHWRELNADEVEPSILREVLSYVHGNTCSYLEECSSVENILTLLSAADHFAIKVSGLEAPERGQYVYTEFGTRVRTGVERKD